MYQGPACSANNMADARLASTRCHHDLQSEMAPCTKPATPAAFNKGLMPCGQLWDLIYGMLGMSRRPVLLQLCTQLQGTCSLIGDGLSDKGLTAGVTSLLATSNLGKPCLSLCLYCVRGQ